MSNASRKRHPLLILSRREQPGVSPGFIYETLAGLIYSDIIGTVIDVYICVHISRPGRAIHFALVTERLSIVRNIGDDRSPAEISRRSLCGRALQICRINIPAASRARALPNMLQIIKDNKADISVRLIGDGNRSPVIIYSESLVSHLSVRTTSINDETFRSRVSLALGITEISNESATTFDTMKEVRKFRAQMTIALTATTIFGDGIMVHCSYRRSSFLKEN